MPILRYNGNKIGGTVEDSLHVNFNNSNTDLEATNVQEAIEAIDSKLTDKSTTYSVLLNKTHISENVQEIVSLSDDLTKYKYISFMFVWNNTSIYSQQTYPTSCFGRSIVQNVVLYGGGSKDYVIQIWPKDNNSIYVKMTDNTYISLSVVAWN